MRFGRLPAIKLGMAVALSSSEAAAGAAFDERAPRLLDAGPEIDPTSLGVEITIAYWTRDRQERFARLP